MEYAEKMILYPVAQMYASTLSNKNIILIVMENAFIMEILAKKKMKNVMETRLFVGLINVYHKAQNLIIGIVTVSVLISLNHVMELVMLIQSLVELIYVSLMEISICIMNVVNNA